MPLESEITSPSSAGQDAVGAAAELLELPELEVTDVELVDGALVDGDTAGLLVLVVDVVDD